MENAQTFLSRITAMQKEARATSESIAVVRTEIASLRAAIEECHAMQADVEQQHKARLLAQLEAERDADAAAQLRSATQPKIDMYRSEASLLLQCWPSIRHDERQARLKAFFDCADAAARKRCALIPDVADLEAPTGEDEDLRGLVYLWLALPTNKAFVDRIQGEIDAAVTRVNAALVAAGRDPAPSVDVMRTLSGSITNGMLRSFIASANTLTHVTTTHTSSH